MKLINTFLLLLAISSASFAQNYLNPEDIYVSSDATITSSSVYLDIRSRFGYIYENVGLPLIGEHYPFNESVPNEIRVQKYGDDVSVASLIVPKYKTNNIGYKSLHGISMQMGKILWLIFAVLLGFIATLSKKFVAGIIGKDNNALNNLFWYGFAGGFILGIFINFQDIFGQNKLIYIDNANDIPYRIEINKDDIIEIGPKENIGLYTRLGKNNLKIIPNNNSDELTEGNIFVKESEGFLIFNIGGRNQYKIVTSAWEK